MTTQDIVWNWNNFRGGLSDNPYLGQEGQFQDGINVDVQTEPNWFKLTAPLAQQISSVATRASIIIDTSDYGLVWDYADLYTFTQYDWSIESKVYKGTSTTAYYTDSTGSKIIWATAMWVSWTLALYYFTGAWTIHKLTLWDVPVHSTLAGSFQSWQDKVPLIHYGDDVYFCAGNKFYKLDSVTETSSVIYTAWTENTFTGITFFQDSFHLYSKASGWATGSSTPRNGRQYIIRVWQTTPDYITKWDRLPIMWACNIWSTDYVVTGFWPRYSDLYVVSWTQRQLIRSNFESMSLGRQFTGDIISWKDEIFLLGRNRDSHQSPYASSIFRLGKYFPWMPQALTEIYRTSTTTYVTTLFTGISDLYIWYDRTSLWGTFSIQKINLDTPVTEYTIEWGYIVSNVYTAGDATVIKYLKEIEISYMCDNTNPYFPHWGTFKIYARKNPVDSWTQIGSTYTKTDIWRVKIVQNEITSANMWDYTQIELKCEIIRSSTTLSPLITGVKVTSTININE